MGPRSPPVDPHLLVWLPVRVTLQTSSKASSTEYRVSLTQGQLPIHRGSPQPVPLSAIVLATHQLSLAMEVAGAPVPWEVVERLALLISFDPSSHRLLLVALLVLALQEPLANT